MNVEGTKRDAIDIVDVKQLLILEDLREKNCTSAVVLGRLVEIYSRLVEHFDNIKDPIKTYFLDKMQNNIANLAQPERLIRKLDFRPGESLSDILKQLNENPEKLFARRTSQRNFEFRLSSLAQNKKAEIENEIPAKMESHENRQKSLDELVRTQLRSQEKTVTSRIDQRRIMSVNKSRFKILDRTSNLDDSRNDRSVLSELLNENQTTFRDDRS